MSKYAKFNRGRKKTLGCRETGEGRFSLAQSPGAPGSRVLSNQARPKIIRVVFPKKICETSARLRACVRRWSKSPPFFVWRHHPLIHAGMQISPPHPHSKGSSDFGRVIDPCEISEGGKKVARVQTTRIKEGMGGEKVRLFNSGWGGVEWDG